MGGVPKKKVSVALWSLWRFGGPFDRRCASEKQAGRQAEGRFELGALPAAMNVILISG